MLIYAEIRCVEVKGNMVYFWINKALGDKIMVPLKNIASYGKVSGVSGSMDYLRDSTGILDMMNYSYGSSRSIDRVITLTNGTTYVFGSPSATSFESFVNAFEKLCSPPESVDLLG